MRETAMAVPEKEKCGRNNAREKSLQEGEEREVLFHEISNNPKVCWISF